MPKSKSKAKPKLKPALTAKDVGLAPHIKLSSTYANSRNHFKTIDVKRVIGYHVIAASPRNKAMIAPICASDVWIKEGKHQSIIRSYEIGPSLNDSEQADLLSSFACDTMAAAASDAISALMRIASWRKEVLKRMKKDGVK